MIYSDSLSVPHQSSDDDDDEIPRAPGHRSGHHEQVPTYEQFTADDKGMRGVGSALQGFELKTVR